LDIFARADLFDLLDRRRASVPDRAGMIGSKIVQQLMQPHIGHGSQVCGSVTGVDVTDPAALNQCHSQAGFPQKISGAAASHASAAIKTSTVNVFAREGNRPVSALVASTVLCPSYTNRDWPARQSLQRRESAVSSDVVWRFPRHKARYASSDI
jgi:hypothetical protein